MAAWQFLILPTHHRMKTTSTHRSLLQREWQQGLLLLLPLAAALLAMPYASHRVPMQWNLQGGVNWYAPKTWGLLVTPVTTLLVILLVMFLESRDKFRLRAEDGSLTSHGHAVRRMRLAISFFLAAITAVQISAALGHQPDVTRLIFTGMALLFAFMGNLFGKLKPNRYVGIRVPWTLNSEHVWRQTHRTAGWIWTTTGIMVAALVWLLPHAFNQEHLLLLWLAILVLPPLAVAWYEARKEKRRRVAP